MQRTGPVIVGELRPPVDFNPPIPKAEPTLEDLVHAWEAGENARRERERTRLWNMAREAAREDAIEGFRLRGDIGRCPDFLTDARTYGPHARNALPRAGGGRVAGAGVDTWSPAWYVPDGSATQAAIAERLPGEGHRARVLQDVVEGHRVMWFPDAGMLAAEGHPVSGRLAAGDELPAVHERLRASISEVLGADVEAEWTAGVRRLDATCDVPHAEPAEGIALLAGVAALTIGGVQSVVRRAASGRRVETVELHGRGGRRILGRVYDKGVERRDGTPPGHLVRLEDQRRYDRHARRAVEELTTEYVRDQWKRRFLPLWRASKGVKVSGPLVLAARIGELIESGELTPAKARAVAGFLLLDAAGIEQGDRTNRWRLRRTCEEAGLVLADGVMQELEVDLGAVVEDVLESDAWGQASAN